MGVLWVVIVCAVFICVTSFNYSRIAVVTVLDLESKEVRRDVFTMMRSLRMNGGRLNEAQLIVCIPTNESSLRGEELEELLRLGAQVSFLEKLTPPFQKTLNKFNALSVVPTQNYDYILWLDADVVLFKDPFLTLEPHNPFGRIDCVPDLYSYLRRYPAVNTTAVVWNEALPRFEMVGDGENAPNGVCNTGILLFDEISLKALLAQVAVIEEVYPELRRYSWDRFYDSLLFVAAVNNGQGIPCRVLGFQYNYMAFFEVEIMMDTNTSDIVMAHFLAETEMYCYNEVAGDGDSCRCLYHNKYIPQGSLIVERVSELLEYRRCNVMSGLLEAPLSENQKKQAAIRSEHLQDDENVILLTVYPAQDFEPFSVKICQYWPPPKFFISSRLVIPFRWCADVSQGSMPSLDHLALDLLVSWTTVGVTPTGAMGGAGESRLQLLLTGMFGSECFNFDVGVDSLSAVSDNDASTVLLTVSPISAVAFFADSTNESLRFEVINSISTKVQFDSENVRVKPQPYGQFITEVDSLQAIRSQLQLTTVLNDLNILEDGIIFCCDSRKGLATSKRLIENWNGRVLHIVLHSNILSLKQASPPELNGIEELSRLCSTHNLSAATGSAKRLCIFWNGSVTSNVNNRDEISPLGLDDSICEKCIGFVYFDYFDAEKWQSFVLLLQNWYKKLRSGGILMGSRYAADLSMIVSQRSIVDRIYLSGGEAVSPIAEALRRAVFDASSPPSVQLTSHELTTQYCDVLHSGNNMLDLSFVIQQECSAAWYIVKT